MYSFKDAKKQAIQVVFEELYTLEDLGIMDRQALIVTEVLTDHAKTIIQEHYYNNYSSEAATPSSKDTSLLRSSLNYSQN